MANPNESEHDRQFREDLEKATALSMETLALDQFRRNKLYRSDSTSEQHSNPLYGSTCMRVSLHLLGEFIWLMFENFQLSLIVVQILTIKVKQISCKTQRAQGL